MLTHVAFGEKRQQSKVVQIPNIPRLEVRLLHSTPQIRNMLKAGSHERLEPPALQLAKFVNGQMVRCLHVLQDAQRVVTLQALLKPEPDRFC
jgi:hypothetical protein